MELLRNLARRPARTGLTVLGIAVGMLAFTVMGGMAEKLNMIIRGGEAYFAQRISVRSTGGVFRLNLLSPEDIDIVKEIPGVQAVETHIMMPMDETAGFELAPRYLVGIDLANFMEAQELTAPAGRLRLDRGRWWTPGQRNVAVLGSAVAEKMKLGLGDMLEARGHRFEVVGLMKETLSLPDGWAIIPEPDARELLLADASFLRTLGITEFYTNAYALVAQEQGDAITEVMASQLRKGFLLFSPQQLIKATAEASTILNTSIFGAGAVAVLVAALSVVNTMLIAVRERTREIGIKKAIGASRGDIVREFLAESTMMGILGGVLGLGLGAATIWAINWWTRDMGTPVFILTGRLALAAMGFAVALGAVSGVAPALRASKLHPVHALREL